MRHGTLLASIGAIALTIIQSATAQMEPPRVDDVDIRLDSGSVTSRNDSAGVIFSDVVHVEGAATMRLLFDDVSLGKNPSNNQPAILRITSLRDGGQQFLTVTTAKQWGFTSAYFNGDTLLIEIIAGANAGPSRVAASTVEVTRDESIAPRTICGPTDDRVISTDPRVGRVISNGCTAWLINDAQHCMLTAGHCTVPNFNVIEFNYPPSNSEGVWQHAHPDHQYVVDASSIQRRDSGIGDDFAYFGCFANSNTGLTAFQAQGASFVLATTIPTPSGQTLRITGNGTTDMSVPPEHQRAQKTHTGAFVSHTTNALTYSIDTTGGNSGSPIIDESTGLAIGIHTHGGCTTGGGANAGTAITHPNLQNVLANPLGVCAAPGPTLLITFPSAVPALLDPDGQQIVVSIVGANGAALNQSSPTLFYNTGSGYVSIVMQSLGGSLYAASTPAIACGTNVSFYVSAQTMQGATVNSPAGAPATAYTAQSAEWLRTALYDSGDTDQGWNITNTQPLTGGAWERGIPAGGGDRGDPRIDFDGNYYCWLTANFNGDSDVDGGPTQLVSRTLDLTTFADPRLSYARWFYSDTPGPLDFDRLEIHLSSNDGQSWTLVESVITVQQWTKKNFRVGDFVPITSTVRVRFSAYDVPNNSIVEAAVDAVHVYDVECEDRGDLVAPFDKVNVADLFALLANWGTNGPGATIAEPYNLVDVADLFGLLSNWTQ